MIVIVDELHHVLLSFKSIVKLRLRGEISYYPLFFVRLAEGNPWQPVTYPLHNFLLIL
jgi:hypothetical protein